MLNNIKMFCNEKFGNKNKKEIMGQDEKQIQNENIEEIESSEQKAGEIDGMSERKDKKGYIYIALDKKNGMIFLDEKNQPIFSNITKEGNQVVNWPEDVRKYADRLDIDFSLREEVPALKNSSKRQLRENAKEKLRISCEEKISEAKRIKSGSSDESKKAELQSDLQQGDILLEKMQAKAEQIVADVDKLGEQINQDISNATDDILGTIAENDKVLVSDIKGAIQEQGREFYGRTERHIEKSINILVQKTQKAAEDVSRKVNDTGRNIGDSQEKILSKVNTVGKRMSDLVESVEGIEGNLTRLEQLDEIAALLKDKSLNISMEIPPVNAEEEDIINLVRYSQKITEQLGYAARDLIRKSEALKSQAESNDNEQKMMIKKIKDVHQEGIAEGKKQVIKKLLSKYEDVDAIKDSKDNYIHVIWTMLTELGVVIDGDGLYEKGTEIELSDEDIEKMMATYSKFDGAGKYRVIRTGLSLCGEIISVAQFAKLIEGEMVAETESQESENNDEGVERETDGAEMSKETKEKDKTADEAVVLRGRR